MSQDNAIKAIDTGSIHRITSGQVVIDLQTAVKELVENSLDAGSTNIDVRFKQYGLRSIEVVDNGSGIHEEYHDSIALKHYTSKLSSFSDLSTIRTFGFRGEALSSLCALSELVTVSTATEPPMGVLLTMDASGKVCKKTKVARQRGTTVTLTNLFQPLPVRRKEFERNLKREFGKALGLLNAYALGPCCTTGEGVRFAVTNQVDKGQKSVQLRVSGATSSRAAVSALWGPKSLENLVDLDLGFDVQRDRVALRRMNIHVSDDDSVHVVVKGLISKFTPGGGRAGTDRQFFYVNGRPCNLSKIQKAFNEVYRTFNVNQAPFILADFIIPTESCDINVSPDKRTIFIHSEDKLIAQLKAALEASFAHSRSTYDVGGVESQSQRHQVKLSSSIPSQKSARSTSRSASDADGDLIRAFTKPTAVVPSQEPATPPNSNVAESVCASGLSSSDLLKLASTAGELRSSSSAPSYAQISGVATARSDAVVMHDDTSQHPEPQSDNESEKDHPVTIDTTKTSWSQHIESVSPSPEAEEEPARKKRKVEIPAAGSQTEAEPPWKDGSTPVTRISPIRSTRSSWPNKSARNQLRTRLASFARFGSQISTSPTPNAEKSDEDMGDEATSGDDLVDESIVVGHEDHSSILQSPEHRGRLIQLKIPQTKDDTPVSDDVRTEAKTSSSLVQADDVDSDEEISIFEPDDHLNSSSSQEVVARPEVIRSSDTVNGTVALRFDLSTITSRWLTASASSDDPSLAEPSFRVPEGAGLSNTEDTEQAAEALSRVIEKDDFGKMEVVGQFNLGFIVARRRKGVTEKVIGSQTPLVEVGMDDLFIIDQHAADEKYNFETLQQTTKIKSQQLIRPQPIQLTAADELVATENVDVFRQNGFEIAVDEDAEAGQGKRLKLVAQPTSKSVVFDMKDLEELVNLMRHNPKGQMVRCSKARAMFAMRACRKSVMVGMPLNLPQMYTVVQHMGTMDQPWNCPHGRPTMRHLADLAHNRLEKAPKVVDWSTFHAV